MDLGIAPASAVVAVGARPACREADADFHAARWFTRVMDERVGVAAYKEKGRPVILLRDQTETSDIQALAEAEALVTAHGARTSHAAVVARQLGKVCLVACQSLRIDGSARGATLGGSEIKEGETLTVDGTTGSIFRGEILVRRVKPTDLVKLALSWSKSPARQ